MRMWCRPIANVIYQAQWRFGSYFLGCVFGRAGRAGCIRMVGMCYDILV